MSRATADRQERDIEDMAVQSIMQVRAMYEDNVSVDSLTGKKERKSQSNDDSKEETGSRRTVTKEEKKAELSSLENKLGKAVKK